MKYLSDFTSLTSLPSHLTTTLLLSHLTSHPPPASSHLPASSRRPRDGALRVRAEKGSSPVDAEKDAERDVESLTEAADLADVPAASQEDLEAALAAEAVVSADLGCLLHLESVAGGPRQLPVYHVAELLAPVSGGRRTP